MTCSTLKETKIYVYYTKFKRKHAKTHIKEKKQILRNIRKGKKGNDRTAK